MTNSEKMLLPKPASRLPALAMITAAMEEEAAPIREAATQKSNRIRFGTKGNLQLLEIEDATLALVTTGIGLTNAASSLTSALTYVSPRYIFSCGSAGGLDANSKVGEVTAASDCVYGRADAREFGYALGQIPGMPESFIASEDLLTRFTSLPAKLGNTTTRVGRFLSSDCFVSTTLATEFRKLFPTAITVDMESAALAQVAAGAEIPFLALRGISDLCGPEAAADNYQRAPEASRLSFLVALTLIGLREPAEIV